MRSKVVLGVLAGGALCWGICAPRPAVACGGAMMDEASYVERAIAKRAQLHEAQQLVEARKLPEAAKALRRAAPFQGGSLQRGRRVLAQLMVRSDGAYNQWASRAGDAAKNLKRAVAILAALPRDDPRTLTALGEALSKQESTRELAREGLEDLARRDLITSAEGWAALARLRGDANGDEALLRCRRMAVDATASCGRAAENASELGES